VSASCHFTSPRGSLRTEEPIGVRQRVVCEQTMTPSLCESCKHVREVRTARSRFLLCQLSATNAEYPKYPPQPVVRCDGYRLRGEATPEGQGDPPGQHD
jgi:hypothetical protein